MSAAGHNSPSVQRQLPGGVRFLSSRSPPRSIRPRRSFPIASARGVEIMPLFLDNREDVRLERWARGATVALDASGGMEVLVLAGSFSERGEAFVLQSWLRLPTDGAAWAMLGVTGARVWIKRGPLAEMPQPPA